LQGKLKILIIGSKGFIGSHCADYFISRGFEVFQSDVTDNTEDNYFLIRRENSDFSLPFKELQFDLCINASGSANVGFSFENPAVDFELNVINVQKILVAIRDFNPQCKFINFSSAAVYGSPRVLPISENSTCKPLSPYGFHKLQSELLLLEYHKFFGLKTCSLRVFSAYGPRLQKQLFWDLYQKSLQSDEISLFGTGDESRDFIYIDDLMQAVDLVMNNSDFNGSIYNVASQVETTIHDATKVFIDQICPGKPIVFNNVEKAGDPKNWLADMQQIRNFGFVPKYSLYLGLKQYAQWIKENG
jgi:dTDP-glucose 4,6-dehydratase/UDP-glucose 4-epimerase